MHNQDQVPDYIKEKLAQEFGTPNEMIEQKEDPTETRKRSPRNRVTIVEHVTHQVEGDNNTAVVAKYGRILDTNTPAYSQKELSVGTDWQQIDTGPLKPEDVGIIIIINTPGPRPQRIPSKEELDAKERAVIEIGKRIILASPDYNFDQIVDIVHILPRQHAHIDPSAPADFYYIRCLEGVALYNLYIIPR